VIARVTDVQLLQGDLAEAWREGTADFATVAMRFSALESVTEKATAGFSKAIRRSRRRSLKSGRSAGTTAALEASAIQQAS
jgi:hypothetical protein